MTAVVGLLMCTQALGWSGFVFVAVLQALTPYLLMTIVPIAGIACWAHSDRLAFTSGLVGVSGLILAAPLAFTSDRPNSGIDDAAVTVAAVNLLYSNPVVEQAADDLLTRDTDTILFTEYTPEFRELLRSHPLSTMYPFKVEREEQLAGGIALWSRYPLREATQPATFYDTLDVRLEAPEGPIRVVGVHPPTPMFRFDRWAEDLGTFGDVGGAAEEPTLIIGDFNASYWHPAFRGILKQGFIGAHDAHGEGFSTSWPMDRWFPAFVRLDHALTGNGLVSTGVEDFTVPGSDHRGLVVSVAPAQ